MIRVLAISFLAILFLFFGGICLAQQSIQKDISTSWLSADGFEIGFKEDGNIIGDRTELKNYWISSDTVLFNHYYAGGVSYSLPTQGRPIAYDTIHSKTFFSRFKIKKLTEDSLILNALDSVATSTISSIKGSVLFRSSQSSILKLFRLDNVYQEFKYDSVYLKLSVDDHFAKWDKEFNIYPTGDYNYKNARLVYSEKKSVLTKYEARLSTTNRIIFQELLNKSGVQYFQFRRNIRFTTHAVNCDLKIFCGDHTYRIERTRFELPETIEKLVDTISKLERK